MDHHPSADPGDDQEARSLLAHEFERHRPYLRGVAYRMLGSMAEAEDALQECWLRLDRRPPADRSDLRPWLTTVTGRICLDRLRARRSRSEGGPGPSLPEPIVVPYDSPEAAVVLADSIGIALLIVFETLSPAERLAFVLHDVFGVPFEAIGPMVGRSPAATRQLASRARRRVRAARVEPDADLTVQRPIVDAFLAASRDGDLERLLMLLDPDVVLRIDAGARPLVAPPPMSGAEPVAAYLRSNARFFAPLCTPAVVNGGAGIVVGPPGRVIGVVAIAVVGGRIRAIDIVADPAKLSGVHAWDEGIQSDGPLLTHCMTLDDVKNLLAYSSITLTSNTYGHVLEQRQREVAQGDGRGARRVTRAQVRSWPQSSRTTPARREDTTLPRPSRRTISATTRAPTASAHQRPKRVGQDQARQADHREQRGYRRQDAVRPESPASQGVRPPGTWRPRAPAARWRTPARGPRSRRTRQGGTARPGIGANPRPDTAPGRSGPRRPHARRSARPGRREDARGSRPGTAR